jgi:HSP20 family molecular chaperone IbpA
MISRFNDQNWFPTLFNDFFDNDFWMTNRKNNLTAPAVNVLDEEKEYKVEIAAPGMTKDDFQIKIDNDNNLVITLEKKTETKEGDTTKENETKAQEATTKETSKETVSHHYKLYIGLNNPETKVYKYVSKMKKADNVVEFFDQVNKELEEACNQDAKLKAVVDALLGDALRDS